MVLFDPRAPFCSCCLQGGHFCIVRQHPIDQVSCLLCYVRELAIVGQHK
jgi:hypothetical protein